MYSICVLKWTSLKIFIMLLEEAIGHRNTGLNSFYLRCHCLVFVEFPEHLLGFPHHFYRGGCDVQQAFVVSTLTLGILNGCSHTFQEVFKYLQV